MKRINTKNGALTSVLLVMSLTFLLCLILSDEITLWTILMRLPTAFTIYGIILIIFTKWLWKFRIFKEWLVLIPNLSGEWRGNLITTYQDSETGEKKDSKNINANIKQDLFHISIILRTEEMKSTSFIAAFDIDNNQNRNRVCYIYTSLPKPEYRENSPIHYGSALLDIVGNPPYKLSGEYWTTRKTTGTIELKKHSRSKQTHKRRTKKWNTE